MASRIEKRHDFSRLGIDASDVRPFVAVAREAAQTKIVGLRQTFMILCDDVVDFEGNSIAALGDLTVFATVASSPPD